MSTVGSEIPLLRLDAGRVHDHPFQVFLGELGVRDRLCLLGDGLDRIGPVDGFLRAGDIRESICCATLACEAVIFRVFSHMHVLLLCPVEHVCVPTISRLVVLLRLEWRGKKGLSGVEAQEQVELRSISGCNAGGSRQAAMFCRENYSVSVRAVLRLATVSGRRSKT
jgi:hypothetical protein